MDIGVTVLPRFSRIPPIATALAVRLHGNKFEFRLVGSAFSIADPNTVLNTIVASRCACSPTS